MPRRSLIYLPVEIGKRELMSRAFLSSRLASEGHDVLIFASDLFDAIGWPGKGLYIGKNVLREYAPHNLIFYNRMKAQGIEVWYHDEEGGLFPGLDPEEWAGYLVKRTDPMVFDETDKILAWGTFQAEHYRSISVSADVRVIGSVNFELYKPEYHDTLSVYDREQTGGRRDYILFNTRTPGANNPVRADVHPINGPPYTFSLSDKQRFDRLSHEGIVLYELIGLIAEIALRHPDELVVIRPHPGEDSTFYKSIFGGLRNVLVTGEGDAGAWIRRSRCLIQNGCTTAIQANIAEKRVITFMPPGTDGSGHVSPFPNEIGVIAETRGAAIDAIFADRVPQHAGRWNMVVSSISTIADIARLVAERSVDERLDERRLINAVRARDWNMRSRKLAYRLVPGKLQEHRLREQMIDRQFFNRFGELVAMAARHWKAPVSASRISSDCWRVRLS